ncbi:hypothetical protein SAY87_003672 [Trapa incisa]|uniref:3'-5' exonuclease n=1 Tax=Trapa incisa TaxID=236973 RepID=A0AAN7KRN0_9MYRT|nr:hypothetical protein SAY87_003672 [Trapa incisa]
MPCSFSFCTFLNTIISLLPLISIPMEIRSTPTLSSSVITSSLLSDEIPIAVLEWDDPLTQEDLDAIDAAVAASIATTSNHKRRHSPVADDSRITAFRRRLPRSFSRSPCQVNEETMYSLMRFGGQILYRRSSIEVEKAAIEILKNIHTMKRLTGQGAIGFDIEWRPTFRRGFPARKAAVMQICCSADYCYVLHIIHSGVPPSLKLLLEDNTIVKVGVGVFNDAIKVQKDYNVSVQACEDLSCLAKGKLVHDQSRWSLASLTETLVSKQLPKPKNIRLGNWEALFLSKEQLEYAAMDAFASWHLYEVLKSLPDLETNNCENDN